MKTAATRTDLVPTGLRQAAEEVLTDGETQSGFVARGLASRDAAHASGRYVTATTVAGKLARRLKNARKKAAIAK